MRYPLRYFAALCGLMAVGGCSPSSPPADTGTPVRVATPATPRPVRLPDTVSPDLPHATGAMSRALQLAFNDPKYHAVFPPHVVVISVGLSGGLVSLDLSKEFNKVVDMGDTTEANAQKELRHILAKFPDAKTLKVTANGKPVDSQMTDWTQPFPIHESGADQPASGKAGGGVPE